VSSRSLGFFFLKEGIASSYGRSIQHSCSNYFIQSALSEKFTDRNVNLHGKLQPKVQEETESRVKRKSNTDN